MGLALCTHTCPYFTWEKLFGVNAAKKIRKFIPAYSKTGPEPGPTALPFQVSAVLPNLSCFSWWD